MSRFQVKKVSGYNAGYPERITQGSIPVLKKIPIKLFSIFVVGFIFLLTAPGCHILFPGWYDEGGIPNPYKECYEDSDCSEGEYCDYGRCREKVPDEETGDFETEEPDMVEVECVEDKDCPDGYCYGNICYEENLLGDPMPDCRYDGCWEGYECNEETGECELSEKPDHKEFPDENADDFETDGEDIDEDSTDLSDDLSDEVLTESDDESGDFENEDI